MIERVGLRPEEEGVIRSPHFCGGSTIVGADRREIAGPMGLEEGIPYADLDLEVGVRMKLRHDFAGHFNRPDVLQLHLNTRNPSLVELIDRPQRAPAVPGRPAHPLEEQPVHELPRPPHGD